MGTGIFAVRMMNVGISPVSTTAPGGGGAGGSIVFNGIDTVLTVPASADWALGSDNFTIEWFQYQISGNGVSAPRPFSVGGWPSASVAVSIESEVMYFWANGDLRLSALLSNFMDTWTYFAIVRNGSTVTVYQNGTPITSDTFTENITDASNPLAIGAEYATPFADVTHFNGHITNFRWTKGLARYTSAFTVPSAPLSADASTELLLLATNSSNLLTDSSSNNKPVSDENGLVSWSSLTPF